MSANVPSSVANLPYVERKAAIRGGRPVIRGTRFLVSDVVWHYKRGLTVEEILQHFPHLTAAQIHGALAYYHEHQAEIEAEMREDDDAVAWMKRYPESSPPLAARGYAILTYDQRDFPRLHYERLRQGREHGGIFIGIKRDARRTLRGLLRLPSEVRPEEVKNRLEYLSNWT